MGDTQSPSQREQTGVCAPAPGYLGCWAGRGEAADAAARPVSGNCCSPGSSCPPAPHPRWGPGPSCSSRILRGILSAGTGTGQSHGTAEPRPFPCHQHPPPRPSSFLYVTKDSASAITPPNIPMGLPPPTSPGTFAQTCLWQRRALSVLWVRYPILSGVGEVQDQAPEPPRLQECGANGAKAALGNIPWNTLGLLCNPPAQGSTPGSRFKRSLRALWGFPLKETQSRHHQTQRVPPPPRGGLTQPPGCGRRN